MRLKKWAAVGALSFVLALAAPSAALQATEQTFFIQVGGQLGDDFKRLPAEGRRFYPEEVMVHKGDLITYSVQGFHTVTVLPTGTNVDDWVATNVTSIDGAYSLVKPDPDDGPGELKYNTAIDTQESCGTSTDDACVYNGTTQFHCGPVMGEPCESFTIRVQNNPGETFTVLSVLQPDMRQTITVVDQNQTADDPAVVSAEAGSAITEDTVAARTVHRRFKDKRVKRNGAFQAWVGIDRTTFSLMAMYPKKLSFRKGSKVNFRFSQLIHEPHTATMPGVALGTTSEHFLVPVCDPDGDDGTQPDMTATFSDDAPPCPEGSELEFDIDAIVGTQQGNGIFTGRSDYENSGILGPASMGLSSDPWMVKVKKDGRYFCAIHPFMKGKLNVR